MILSATGHRPIKLGGYGVGTQNRLTKLAMDYLKDNTPDRIISGMALGWDTAWARAGLALDIPVIAAVPFKGQESTWPDESQDIYNMILSRCAEVVFVCTPGYEPWKMQTRNEYMIDASNKVIALWDGSPGGTANCIKYAQSINRPIVNLWAKFEIPVRVQYTKL